MTTRITIPPVRSTVLALVMAAIALSAAPVRATEPPDREPPPTREQQPPRKPRDADRPEFQRFRAQMRTHLQDRLDRAKRMVNRIEEAQRLLESGSDPARLKTILDSLAAEGRRPAERRDTGRAVGTGVPGGPGGPEGSGAPGGSPVRERALGMAGLDGEPARPLSPDEREEVMAMFRERAPEIARGLEALRERHAEFYERTVDSLGPRARLIRESLAHKDDEMLRLRLEDVGNTLSILRLSAAFASANRARDAEQVARIETELRAALGRQFDTRLGIRRRELHQLERRVDAMKKELETIADRRDQIIEAVKVRGFPAGERDRDRDHDNDDRPEPQPKK